MKRTTILVLALLRVVPLHATNGMSVTTKGKLRIIGGEVMMAASVGVLAMQIADLFSSKSTLGRNDMPWYHPWSPWVQIMTIVGFQWAQLLKAEGSTYFPTEQAKQKLVNEIRNDMYTIYVQETAILSKDWAVMAWNNTELAEDVKNLYSDFNQLNQDEAQNKVDALCQKWSLDSINLHN